MPSRAEYEKVATKWRRDSSELLSLLAPPPSSPVVELQDGQEVQCRSLSPSECLFPLCQADVLLSRAELRSLFSKARIKKMIQADEDVGKVAQATPIVVCTSR
jgi:hypothetical protein